MTTKAAHTNVATEPKPTLPTLEILPERNGVLDKDTTHVDVLVRITPPAPLEVATRPALNLALVIDRSGSMHGEPLERAKEAAAYAVRELLPDDRVAVVAFDHAVRVVVESTEARDKTAIVRAIEAIQAGGSTALHDGWLEGATQVSRHVDPKRLNRVILLSDGGANAGETRTDVIADHVSGLQGHGVGTTAIGFGMHFNEDLMQAIAAGGQGNYYFVEGAADLPRVFEAELQGLQATRGTNVRLRFVGPSGTAVDEIYNDFKTLPDGQLVLPNLTHGMPILIAARIRVPAGSGGTVGELVLTWTDPQTQAQHELAVPVTAPVVSQEEYDALPANAETKAFFAEMKATRIKEEAVRHLDRGDYAAVRSSLYSARSMIASAPMNDRSYRELDEIDALGAAIDSGEYAVGRKRITDQIYRKKQSRGFLGPAGGSPAAPRTPTAPHGHANANVDDRIEVVLGDITDETTDAIVNPTNSMMRGTSGVDGAVHRRAGPELTLECRRIGGLKPGNAVATRGYRLNAAYVLHVAGEPWQGGSPHSRRTLERGYRSALELAASLRLDSVAFPAIGTGHNGAPREEATAIAVATVRSFLQAHPTMRVRFVLREPATYRAYTQELQA